MRTFIDRIHALQQTLAPLVKTPPAPVDGQYQPSMLFAATRNQELVYTAWLDPIGDATSDLISLLCSVGCVLPVDDFITVHEHGSDGEYGSGGGSPRRTMLMSTSGGIAEYRNRADFTAGEEPWMVSFSPTECDEGYVDELATGARHIDPGMTVDPALARRLVGFTNDCLRGHNKASKITFHNPTLAVTITEPEHDNT